MIEIEDRGPTIVTTPVATDGGANAVAAIVLAVMFVALIGYLVYSFSLHGPTTIIERDTNNSTVQQPTPAPVLAPVVNVAPAPVVNVLPAPAPAAPTAPAAPAPTASDSGAASESAN